MRKFNNTKIMYIFTCFLFITQACNKDHGNSDVKATLQKDSIKIEIRTKSDEFNKNDMKYKLDMIDGIWYICKRFSEISYTDTIRNPTNILVVSNKVISKFNKNKLIFTDSLVQTKNSLRLTEYESQKRKSYISLKYLKDSDEIRLLIGGYDGTREIYKRKIE